MSKIGFTAPDLFAALSAIMKDTGRKEIHPAHRGQAYVALAKARGETWAKGTGET